jgi:cytochrome c553
VTGSRFAIALALAVAAGAAAAQPQPAGQQKAQQVCAVCHGPQGVSSAPDAPHLAGQPAMYLITQLRHYRSGERKHEVMNVVAKTLSDQDIEAVAAWYAAFRIEATPPR